MTAIHIPIGEPVNNSEKRVFKYLKDNLPDGYILYTNLSINQGGQDYDFDAVVLGKHAVYVIEIKNFGGIIRGNSFKWQVHGDNGAVYTVPKNPLFQASMQARILNGKLRQANAKYSSVYVQEVVCLAGEKKPQIEIQDDPSRLKKIQWYRGIEKFLTDRSQLLHPPSWTHLTTDDISRFHADIQKAIETGFSISSTPASKLPQVIKGFQVGDVAWSSRGYKAYFASRQGGYPEQALLKIYKIPPTANPAAAKQFVDGLAREFAALRKMRETGNASGGGYKNVAIGYDAFPLGAETQRINEYVVVTEWVEGKHLLELISPRSLSLRQKYQIAAQTCRGLLFAHSADVVHRNLNTENILYEPSGNVKIVNFDFAKFLGAPPMGTLTLPTSMPEEYFKDYMDELMKQRKYVAPEIRIGEGLPSYHDASKETDLYSLGIILLELFSGAPLKNEIPPDPKTLQSVVGLDPKAAKSISLLCSSRIEDRKAVSLDDVAREFTVLAQGEKDISLPELPADYCFGKYEIVSRLSRTHMSDVYKARDKDLDRSVAIKFLRASSNDAVNEIRAAYHSWSVIDQRYTARWLKEGVAFALNGKIIDGSSDDINAIRVHYLVMEFVEGQTIEQLLGDGLPASGEAMEMGSKIIRAVSAIHAAQWTHRDIKPDNIIVGVDGSIRVVDFGLSHRIDEPAADAQQGYSPGYTPPEVRLDEPLPWSYAGDVFSTARVILALLFGKKNHEGPDFDSQKDKAKLEQIAGYSLAGLLLRDIDTNPNNRHDSAMSMLQDWESGIKQREENMAEIDYEKVLQKIEALAEEKRNKWEYESANVYSNEAGALRNWLKNGKQGECPIDLKKYGIDAASLPKETNLSEKTAEKKLLNEPAPSSAEPDEVVVTLSPEERTLQEQLKDVREHIKAGRLRQAVALAGVVAGRAEGDSKVTASELLEEARQKRDAAVEDAIRKADSALGAGGNGQTRQYYEEVLELDPENQRAKSVLRKLESDVSEGKLSAQKINELRGGLRDVRNIIHMGAAVYEAEALNAEGKLTEELADLLEKARAKFDQIRAAQGEETTMMRFGDLSARRDATDKIRARLAQGEQFIFDVTINEEKPAFDLLREADILLEQQSADTAQYEINVIDGLLPAHPLGAKARLESALAKPFHDHHKRLLEKKLEDINKLLEQQKGAQSFLAQAAEEPDEIRAFGIVLKAQGTFSYLPGMAVEVEQARTKAIAATSRKMEDAFAQARNLLGTEESAQARQIIENALKLIDAWPQPERPELLQSLTLEGRRLLEFDTQITMIRKEAEDPHKVGMALKKLEETRKDPRFAELPELRGFVSEMDQYRDAGDQLREAREAKNQGDWKRVFELTTRIKDGKKAGALGPQVDILYAEAEQEVRIEDARVLLENLEIKKANSILSQILATEKDEKRLAILRERLTPEKRVIDEAIKSTESVQSLYDHAVAIRNGREEERLAALRIFRYLGGISREKYSADWPPYILTLRTDDARKAAVEVGGSLRAKCLDALQKGYKGDKRRKADADELKNLANLARILREGNLIHTTEERSLARWAEVEWGKHQAQSRETEQDWDTVVAIWSKLNTDYPDTEDVLTGLKTAEEHQKIARYVFDRVDQATSAREAILIINDALENPQTQHLKGLKQRREQIFLNKQDALLEDVKRANASGTNETRLNAFIALVDLQDLEELMDIPESRRRSGGELKNLNVSNFKDVADGIIQQSNTFSVSQYGIDKSLEIVGQLISRLQTFMKIAPLFAGRIFELDERLERRKNELTILHQKLKEVQTLLNDVNKPEVWDDAVSRGSFEVLRVKRDAMVAQGIPNLTSIPDIREFDQKMKEMQEAHEHIKSQVTLIKQAFDQSEDFKKVITFLRRLSIRPGDWQIVSQKSYEAILEQMDYQFRVTNIYGGGKSLAGRKEIEAEALRRDEQFDIWRSWEKTCDLKIGEARQAVQTVNGYDLGTKNVPTRNQRLDWERVLLGAQSALDLLTNPPNRSREDILSEKAMIIFDHSREKTALAEEWKHSAEQALRTLDHLLENQGFPSPEDFNYAVTRNDLAGLQKLLAQAEQAGALTEDEKKRLNGYKLTYQRMLQESQKRKSFWKLG